MSPTALLIHMKPAPCRRPVKPNLFRVFAVLILLACVAPPATTGQTRQPVARKFDEFTTGAGGAYSRWYRSYQEEEKELEPRFRRYAAQLRKEGARPYAITYGPRVVGPDAYRSSVASSRAAALWRHLTPAFEWNQINWVNGGFREEAATELWVVPPGASPPCPTPTVRPEDVAYCPDVSIRGDTFVPDPSGPLRFKASVDVYDKRVTPTFVWKVSLGRIVEGQGTDTISVELPEGAKGEVVARVEAQGYSLECPASGSSAFAKTAVGVSHFKVDEFGDIRTGDTKARLDNFAIELQHNPALRAYLVVYGGRGGPRGQAERRASTMKEYLSNTRGIDASRIFTVVGGFRDELSGELWLSPLATPPPTRATIDEAYATQKRR